MRTHPKAKAKGARNRLARHASNKQNGRGKYQHTGLLVSFCLTSQRQVLDRAQPPTLQQGGSPMLIVFDGWTLAAILVSGSSSSCGECYDWVSLGSLVVENLRRGCRTLSVSDGCPWGAGSDRQRVDGCPPVHTRTFARPPAQLLKEASSRLPSRPDDPCLHFADRPCAFCDCVAQRRRSAAGPRGRQTRAFAAPRHSSGLTALPARARLRAALAGKQICLALRDTCKPAIAG